MIIREPVGLTQEHTLFPFDIADFEKNYSGLHSQDSRLFSTFDKKLA